MSHFTQVETKFHNLLILKKVIEELGYTWREGSQHVQVRGYRGQKLDADIVIDTKSSYDIGVVATEDGYTFVGDWDMIMTRAGIEQDEFMKKVTQRYSYHTVMEEIKKKGYEVVEETTGVEQTVKLVVRKWE